MRLKQLPQPVMIFIGVNDNKNNNQFFEDEGT